MPVELEVLFRDATQWRKEAIQLRKVLLGCGLQEEPKWGKACYTSAGKNVAIIQRQKDFLALLFFDGALLKDPEGVLHWPGKSSRIGRRMLFTSVKDVTAKKATIEAYVREALAVKKAGLKVPKLAELTLPDELLAKFRTVRGLKAAFETLTAGRQRHYAIFFAEPKQSATRASRVDKHVARILAGKGLRDS